jgi:ABC-type polysaccharide/polyol phosphate transport system ATPase subunit
MNLRTVHRIEAQNSEVAHSDALIRMTGIGVRYRIPEQRIGTFKEFAIRYLQQQVHYRDFWALRGVHLEIHRGETFGIIGRNGAGKSTLLKVISRVIAPAEGRIWIKGRVSPLLELGAGFHPELTGRENIFLNGTLLGHAYGDIQKHLEEILDFADIGSFVDAPLRTYSSGMAARLGFAVATAWQPEILVLDEVLAVGDEAFRTKCQARIASFRANGTTTLLVTHDMNAARTMCVRAAWLEQGCLQIVDSADETIAAYLQNSDYESGGQAV